MCGRGDGRPARAATRKPDARRSHACGLTVVAIFSSCSLARTTPCATSLPSLLLPAIPCCESLFWMRAPRLTAASRRLSRVAMQRTAAAALSIQTPSGIAWLDMQETLIRSKPRRCRRQEWWAVAERQLAMSRSTLGPRTGLSATPQWDKTPGLVMPLQRELGRELLERLAGASQPHMCCRRAARARVAPTRRKLYF